MKQNNSKTNLQLKKILIENGFLPNQASVYLALLKLGKATVSEIARNAGINRTTGYDILGSLVEKGLVTISGHAPKQEYVAESPEQLKKYLKNETEKAQDRLKEIVGIIPELASIHNVYGKPKVMFYEGKEGLEKVYEDTLTSSETIRGYANVEDMHRALPNYFPNYYKRRAEKGIAVRAILSKNKFAEQRAKYNKEEMREAVFVSSDKYYFSPEINIYDNKIMIASWREKLGIIIESKEIAEAMKSIFELAWGEAKRESDQI